jgi:hypothetical protein
MTDVSELRQVLLKAGKEQLASGKLVANEQFPFEKRVAWRPLLLKAAQ